MPVSRQIICVQFPPLIQIELKDKYPDWYKNCYFVRDMNLIPDSVFLLILPASLLIRLRQKNLKTRIIAFGKADLLESAYLLAADDYLKDPWDCSELIIRSSKFLKESLIRINNYDISINKEIFRINDEIIHITPCQSRILNILFENPNVFFDCKDLQEMMPRGSVTSENSLYVQIHHIRKTLREKLPGCYGKSLILKNSNRRGYMLYLPVENLCKNVNKL